MEMRFKISCSRNRAPKRYQEILDSLNGKFDDVAFRWSFNSVPHLLLEHSGVVYSLCYFGKHSSWRLFFPYMRSNPIKKDFSSWQKAIDFILEQE